MTLPEFPIDPSVSGDIDHIDESLVAADLSQWLHGLYEDALKVDEAQKDTLTDFGVLAEAMEERSMVIRQPYPDEIVPIRYHQMEGRPRGLHPVTAGVDRVVLRFPDLIDEPERLLMLPADQDKFLDVFIEVTTIEGRISRYLYNFSGVKAYSDSLGVDYAKANARSSDHDLFSVAILDTTTTALICQYEHYRDYYMSCVWLGKPAIDNNLTL